MSTEISVVAPMFNEQDCVQAFYERVTQALTGESYEIVVVNDGSGDQTGSLLGEIAKKDEKVRYIELSRNRGQSCAVYCGFQHAVGKYVVMMDGDLQNRPEDIMCLIEKIREGYDLVSGRRGDRKDGESRKIQSRIANWLLRKATGCDVHDMGGFKCLRGDIARGLRIRSGYHRLLPALIHTMGGATCEINVGHDQRFAGVSKYRAFSRAIDVIFDILMLWFQNASKSRPLYFFGKIGALFFVVSAVIFFWLVFERQFHGVALGSRPLFMIDIILFLTSLGSVGLAFVTEQIADIQMGVDDRKPYIVRFDSKRK